MKLTGVIRSTMAVGGNRKHLHGFHQKGRQHLKSPVAALGLPMSDRHAEAVALADDVRRALEHGALQRHDLLTVVDRGSAHVAQLVRRLDALARRQGPVGRRRLAFPRMRGLA